MKIKIKNRYYNSTYIPQYKFLETKLKAILINNKKLPEFKFYGIGLFDGSNGILVCGTDSMGIREFQKFYPITFINKRFEEITKEILGEYHNY